MGRRMTQLDRDQCTQQFAAVEHNEISIVRGEYVPGGQPSVNGFAGADEIRGFFTNLKHGGTPYEEKGEECGERRRSLTGPHGESYRTCFVGTYFGGKIINREWECVGVRAPLDMGKRRARQVSRRTTEATQPSGRAAPVG